MQARPVTGSGVQRPIPRPAASYAVPVTVEEATRAAIRAVADKEIARVEEAQRVAASEATFRQKNLEYTKFELERVAASIEDKAIGDSAQQKKENERLANELLRLQWQLRYYDEKFSAIDDAPAGRFWKRMIMDLRSDIQVQEEWLDIRVNHAQKFLKSYPILKSMEPDLKVELVDQAEMVGTMKKLRDLYSWLHDYLDGVEFFADERISKVELA